MHCQINAGGNDHIDQQSYSMLSHCDVSNGFVKELKRFPLLCYLLQLVITFTLSAYCIRIHHRNVMLVYFDKPLPRKFAHQTYPL